jgi:hypothetical protein
VRFEQLPQSIGLKLSSLLLYVHGVAPDKLDQPTTKPAKVKPPKPRPTEKPEGVETEKTVKPISKPEKVAPAKLHPKEKPEKVAPVKLEEQDQPNKKPGRTAPAKVHPQDKQKGEPDEQGKQR